MCQNDSGLQDLKSAIEELNLPLEEEVTYLKTLPPRSTIKRKKKEDSSSSTSGYNSNCEEKPEEEMIKKLLKKKPDYLKNLMNQVLEEDPVLMNGLPPTPQ